MADFPISHYSKTQVENAGKALRGDLVWDGVDRTRQEEIIQIFRIAWDWRNSHAYPMRKLRQELSGKIRRIKTKGITAARMKRMQSIRKKLTRLTTTLVQIDDLGGCRAVVGSSAEVESLIAMYRSENGPHNKRTDRSYIEDPKLGGYRSHHFVFDFQGCDDTEIVYNGRRIEIQIRTRLQHAWATAVEALGLVRAEDMKAGEGDHDWLRLFELVSSEFADAEGCPVVPGAPNKQERVAELRNLQDKLRATSTLENLNQALKYTENYAGSADYFLIRYDNVNHTVDVRGFGTAGAWPEQFGQQESNSITTVLVEVDKVENLREAYPNYFLDVTLFTRNLQNILGGRKLILSLQDQLGDDPDVNSIPVPSKYNAEWIRKFTRGF